MNENEKEDRIRVYGGLKDLRMKPLVQTAAGTALVLYEADGSRLAGREGGCP